VVELKKTLLVDIKHAFKSQPVIIFLEKKDALFKKALQDLCTSTGTTFVNPENSQDALRLRDQYAGLDRGIILLDMEFGRSVDPKFAKDSEVLILLERDTKVIYSDVM
jgi:hypothetical protein